MLWFCLSPQGGFLGLVFLSRLIDGGGSLFSGRPENQITRQADSGSMSFDSLGFGPILDAKIRKSDRKCRNSLSAVPLSRCCTEPLNPKRCFVCITACSIVAIGPRENLSLCGVFSSSAPPTELCCSQELDSQLEDSKERQDAVTNEPCNKSSAAHVNATIYVASLLFDAEMFASCSSQRIFQTRRSQ